MNKNNTNSYIVQLYLKCRNTLEFWFNKKGKYLTIVAHTYSQVSTGTAHEV